MATYEWSYGAPGTGLYFTITYDPVSGNFTVQSIEGSFDLNALWFSNGDGGGGDTTLSGSDSSLNMNGANTVWEDDGTESKEKIVWDDYALLSSTGLGTEGETKDTFISEGETKVFSDIALPDGWDFTTGTLGVRATSVNGDGSIKYADNEACTADEIVFFDNFSGYTSTGTASWGYKADLAEGGWTGETAGAEIVNDGYQGITGPDDDKGGKSWLDTQRTAGPIDLTQTVDIAGARTTEISASVAAQKFDGYEVGGELVFIWNGSEIARLDEAEEFYDEVGGQTVYNQFKTFTFDVDSVDGDNTLRIVHENDFQNVGYAVDWLEISIC